MGETITTKLMIISDTHCFQFGDAENVQGTFKKPLPKVDILLHCGDLTERGGLEAYKGVIRMLSGIDAELKLVIAGNHDVSLDGPYWYTKACGPANPEAYAEHKRGIEIMTGPLAKEAGVTYLEEGLHNFILTSGAKCTVYASPYQPEFCGWAFPYERDEDRFNPPHQTVAGVKNIAVNPVPAFPGIDIMMTHGPPEGILDKAGRSPRVSAGCHALLRAVSRARPLLYCFGHIHEAHGAMIARWKDDKENVGADAIESLTPKQNNYPESSSWPIQFGKETLMVNAAIMDIDYDPSNSPWVVNLELPRAA
ncbi:Metallophosphoesterase domain-containing 1 [Hyphodiscus hymeniophilus]|uniref:Metallophosphoesterase domain-containing 1 n=1 Tax=Hyphodiscus hymeniophilus TaxID=353542 RepID=A0A9P7AYW6_9HELO|nr:Metallophosphoesterase domain-containing 1 [Hyphodiscus hymeniophilus]